MNMSPGKVTQQTILLLNSVRFILVHIKRKERTISRSLPGSRIDLLFVGTELERCVEWAECENRCQQEHPAKHHQDNTECPGHDAAKIQVGEKRGHDHAEYSIKVGHIAFHGKSPLVC